MMSRDTLAGAVAIDSLGAQHPVAVFCRVFESLSPEREMALDELYAPEVRFEDPLHRLEGLEQVRHYFARLNAGLIAGEFSFGEALIGETAAMVPWTMYLRLRRLRTPVTVAGCSHLRYHTKITHQRDYFDVGALVYEHIPVLGAVVRGIKAAL